MQPLSLIGISISLYYLWKDIQSAQQSEDPFANTYTNQAVRMHQM